MLAISLCLACFVISYLAGRRSLGWGLLAVLAVGYAYGIVRANLPNVLTHFMFDAALVGLYLSQPWRLTGGDRERTVQLRFWTAVLIGWPLLVCLLPFQTLLISLVGLRGNAFMLPALLLGARLRDQDLTKLAYGLAGLNILALGFAAAEYFLGVDRFFPVSEVTAIVYRSNDVAGYRFLRIPSTFANSAAFAGTMVITLPWLYAAWSQRPRFSAPWFVLLLTIGGSLLGVLMGASRMNFIIASIVILVAALGGRVRPLERVAWFTVILVLISMALSNERFQRFKSLANTEMVADRFAGSVNRTFWQILANYPMGNGLGGGGTSIPYFLQGLVKTPIQMENEYARILLEQGLIGLLLWILFIFWAFSRKEAFEANRWQNGRRLAWFCCACYFGSGLIGIGLFTSIPHSMLMLLLVGWITVRQAPEAAPIPSARETRAVASKQWESSMVYRNLAYLDD